MIVDALVQAEAIRQPVTRRKIDPGRSFRIYRCLDGLETRIHVNCLAGERMPHSIATPVTVSLLTRTAFPPSLEPPAAPAAKPHRSRYIQPPLRTHRPSACDKHARACPVYR